MKVIKIQGLSIQKPKQQQQKQSFPKRSLKVQRRKFIGQSTTNKKIEIQLNNNNYNQVINLNQQIIHQNNNHYESQNALIKIKSYKMQSQLNETQIQPNKNSIDYINTINKSQVKLPLIMNPKITIPSKKQIINKKSENSEWVDNVLENYRREDRKTFYNNSIIKNQTKFQKQKDIQSKLKKNQPIYKLMRIQAMRPTQKSPSNHNQMSMRDLQVNRIERTCPLQRINDRNQAQSSLLKTDKASQPKVRKKYSQNFNTTQIQIRKQRRALSITKTTTNKKKTYSNSYLDFCHFITYANKMQRPNQPNGTYKAFVGKGNNSILIKSTLKNRFWWNVIDSDSQINFYWTQQRQNKFLESLKSTQQTTNQENQNQIINNKQFLLQVFENQKNEPTKKNCFQGFYRLLSIQQRKKLCQSPFQCTLSLQPTFGKFQSPNKIRVHNHLQFNWHLTNKKALYYNMKSYYLALKEDPFEFIPLTFHVQKYNDQEWQNFQITYNVKMNQIKQKQEKKKKDKQKNLWIIKPGQNSNQGCGINVAESLDQIKNIVQTKGVRPNGKQRSHIIQKYLMPFLYNKRKFDIRCYILITSINRIIKAYWYEQGYIRTSCKDFNTKNLKSRFIHLTNDAVQKKSQQYGKYENGNKISFNDFQKYIDNNYSNKQWNFYQHVYPKMMKLAADAVKATYMLLNAKNRQYCFEILGLDFMIDEQFNTWLIQVNNNPCLQLSSPLLARIVPNMIQNAFRIAVDPIFPPPKQYPKSKTMLTDLFESNKFTLIFNSNQQGQNLKNLLKGVNLQGIVQSDEQQQGIQDQQN